MLAKLLAKNPSLLIGIFAGLNFALVTILFKVIFVHPFGTAEWQRFFVLIPLQFALGLLLAIASRQRSGFIIVGASLSPFAGIPLDLFAPIYSLPFAYLFWSFAGLTHLATIAGGLLGSKLTSSSPILPS